MASGKFKMANSRKACKSNVFTHTKLCIKLQIFHLPANIAFMIERNLIRRIVLAAALTVGVGVVDQTSGTRINTQARSIAAPLRTADFALSLQPPNRSSNGTATMIVAEQDISVPWTRRLLADVKERMDRTGRNTKRIDMVAKELSAENPNLGAARHTIGKIADSLEGEGRGREARGKAIGVLGAVIFVAAASSEDE